MSSSPDPPKLHRLTVQSHDDAEIHVLDHTLAVLRRAMGWLQGEFPRGLYKIQVSRGGATCEQILELVSDNGLFMPVYSFPAVAPIGPMLGPGAWQEVDRLTQQVRYQPSHVREGILVLGRQKTSSKSNRKPLDGIRVYPWGGGWSPAPEFSEIGGENTTVDGEDWGAQWLPAEERSYVLELRDRRTSFRQVIPVAPGWQTRVFVRRESENTPDSRSEVSVQLALPQSSVVYYDHHETIETARHALEVQRPIFATLRLIMELLYNKFDNPIAGLTGLHLFLSALEAHATASKSRRSPPPIELEPGVVESAPQTIAEVLKNLSILFTGQEQPDEMPADLLALYVRAGQLPKRAFDYQVREPPLFWASWDALRRNTAPGQGVKISRKLWEFIAYSAPVGPYFGWQEGPVRLADYRKSGQGLLRSMSTSKAIGLADAPGFLQPLDVYDTADALGIPRSVIDDEAGEIATDRASPNREA
jgi:hypothetical protein